MARISEIGSRMMPKQYRPDIAGVGVFRLIVEPDPRRWAILFSVMNGFTVQLTISPADEKQARIELASNQQLEFKFKDWGPIVQGAWYAANNPGGRALCITEVVLLDD